MTDTTHESKHKASHTPGPWATDYSGNIWGDVNNPAHDGDSPLIAQVFRGSFEPQKSQPLDAEQVANARLIAAAPTMRDTLIIIARLKMHGEVDADGEPFDMTADDALDTLHACIDMARRDLGYWPYGEAA